jgi:ABC-2 type transport system permease protein
MTGVGKLVRLILRRDRALLPIWVLIFGLLPALYVSSFNGLFPTAADRRNYYDISVHNAGFVALYGRLSGSDTGELVAWRAGFVPVMIGLISLLTVIRHTRTDEEAGRTELIGAAAISRHAPLTAALLVTGAANLLIGVLVAVSLIGQGLAVGGSLALGAEFALGGAAFGAVGAVTAQLSGTARGARSIAIVVLGVAWALRLAGDISAIGSGGLAWLSWITPIGWIQHIFPFGGDHWWPVAPAAMCTAAGGILAVVLLGRRDFGAGLLPARLGPATAAPSLRSPLALAWRMHRGLLAGWALGFAALGLVFGGVADSVRTLAGENGDIAETFQRLGGSAALVDSYQAGTASLFGLIAAGYAVQCALRLREEETTGHAEVLLTDRVGRLRWAGGHLLFALLGPAVVLAVAGLLEGLTYGLISHDLGGQVVKGLAATMAQLPAVWVLAAVATVLFGLVPRLAGLAWGAVAACVLVLLVGSTLRLNQWLLDVSPFTHVPRVPGGHVAVLPFVVLTVVAVVLAAIGLTGFRRRDVPA